MKTHLEQLEEYLENHDRLLATSLYTTKQMKSSKSFKKVADELLAFIFHRYGLTALDSYCQRNNNLMQIQKVFESKGEYSFKNYSDVVNIDREIYNLSLLISFVVANHRYEILDELKQFLKMEVQTPKTILSVGVGTGYEMKVMRDYLPQWSIEAYDVSAESISYARDLLKFYNCSDQGLLESHFPLEEKAGVGAFKSKFGKIVLCEVLEHLENPEQAIKNLAEALHPAGRIFLTMAVNIAQEDHIYLYASADQAREQVLRSGLQIEKELVTPMTLLPFDEKDREKKFKKGNYICIATKNTGI